MIAPLRALRRTALLVTLSVTALAATSQLAPTTHAAGFPTISATAAGPGRITLTGENFTPGSRVELIVTNGKHMPIRYAFITATSRVCTLFKCYPGGRVYDTLSFLPVWQTDHILAHDLKTGMYSNWANVYVFG